MKGFSDELLSDADAGVLERPKGPTPTLVP
jgi:hypothetical protein